VDGTEVCLGQDDLPVLERGDFGEAAAEDAMGNGKTIEMLI
jgi:hypothetical protein